MTAFVLKIIAMLTMLCDHCNELFGQPPLGWYIGRLAFPLYALMLVDSFRHLRAHPERMKKYVLTLAILALVSEFAYDRAFAGVWVFWGGQNQILQFLLFVLAALLAEKLPQRSLRVLVWLAFIALSELCLLGYYALGAVAMLLLRLYLDRREELSVPRRFLAAAAVMAVYCVGCVGQELLLYPQGYIFPGYGLYWPVVLSRLGSYAVTLLLIPVIALYNGQYGDPPKWFRVTYKYFYPAHLFILALIASLLRG